MISTLEGIHNGHVLVVFDHGFKVVNVTNVLTNTHITFHDNPELWELYQLFVQHFHETVTYEEACLFFQKDLIK